MFVCLSNGYLGVPSLLLLSFFFSRDRSATQGQTNPICLATCSQTYWVVEWSQERKNERRAWVGRKIGDTWEISGKKSGRWVKGVWEEYEELGELRCWKVEVGGICMKWEGSRWFKRRVGVCREQPEGHRFWKLSFFIISLMGIEVNELLSVQRGKTGVHVAIV